MSAGSSMKAGIAARLPQPASRPNSFRTTTRDLAAGSCAGSTIRSSTRKANWFARSRARSSTSPSTCGARHPRSVSRWGACCPRPTSTCCGSPPGLRTASWSYRTTRNSSTRRPITGTLSMSARCSRTLPRSPSHGRWRVNPFSPPRTRPERNSPSPIRTLEMRRPRILLTGAAGQGGYELAGLLPAHGDLVATDRVALDLAQPDAIVAVMREVRPDLVVNAGADTAVDAAERDRARGFAVNGRAPQILADEVKRSGALLIHYSTDYVFDGNATSPYDEDAPVAPLNVYGQSKLDGERAIVASGARALILRTSRVYGFRGKKFP